MLEVGLARSRDQLSTPEQPRYLQLRRDDFGIGGLMSYLVVVHDDHG